MKIEIFSDLRYNDFMDKKMNIYLEGIERSGNVFLSYCLGLSIENDLISTRNHELDSIKGYCGNEPFVVPVRDALDSVISSKVYRDYVVINKLYGAKDDEHADIGFIINRYKKYMTFLLHNEKFFIAPFHEFTKDHNGVIDVLVKKYPGLSIEKYYTKEEMIKEILEKDKGGGIEHPELGNLPRTHSLEKTKIKKILLSDYKEQIKEIQDIIDLLYERYYSYKTG
jgi:hypothetical protein